MGLYNNGSYKIIKGGTLVSVSPYNASIYTFPGVDYPNTSMAHSIGSWFCEYATNSVTAGQFLWQQDRNTMKLIDGSNTVILQRGSGNCAGTPTPCTGDSIGLTNLLIPGSASTTWLTSSCYVADGGIISYTFNGNFTGSFVAPDNTMHTMTWAIRKDPFQAQCIYEVYALTVDGSSTYAPMVGSISFMPPYSGNILYFTQPGGSSCSPSSYYMTK